MKKCILTHVLKRKSRLLSLAGDTTRIRILSMLFENGRMRVTEIAESLNMSVACISHHLQLLKDSQVLNSSREGNNIYYVLHQSEFIEKLKKIIVS